MTALYVALTLVVVICVPLCVRQYIAMREHLRSLDALPLGYGDDRDPRWTRKLAPRSSGEALQRLIDSGAPLTESQKIAADYRRRSLDALPPLDGDPLDEGWGKLT